MRTSAEITTSPLHEQLDEIHGQFKDILHDIKTGMLINGQAKYVAHHIPDTTPSIQVLMITDVQYGSKDCRVKKLIEYRDWILAKPYRYCVWGGDMVDAWSIGSPGTGFDNLMDADNQCYQFCKLMAPLRHRVLGFVGGNHERRGLKGGVELGAAIARIMKIPYSAGAQFISINFGQWKGENDLRIYLWHGRGASRTRGAQVNMTMSAVPNDNAHVYLSGHIHNAHLVPGWHVVRNPKSMGVDIRKFYVASASSFLRFFGSYGEVAGYSVHDLMMPLISIRANGTFRVTL